MHKLLEFNNFTVKIQMPAKPSRLAEGLTSCRPGSSLEFSTNGPERWTSFVSRFQSGFFEESTIPPGRRQQMAPLTVARRTQERLERLQKVVFGSFLMQFWQFFDVFLTQKMSSGPMIAVRIPHAGNSRALTGLIHHRVGAPPRSQASTRMASFSGVEREKRFARTSYPLASMRSSRRR